MFCQSKILGKWLLKCWVLSPAAHWTAESGTSPETVEQGTDWGCSNRFFCALLPPNPIKFWTCPHVLSSTPEANEKVLLYSLSHFPCQQWLLLGRVIVGRAPFFFTLRLENNSSAQIFKLIFFSGSQHGVKSSICKFCCCCCCNNWAILAHSPNSAASIAGRLKITNSVCQYKPILPYGLSLNKISV